MNYNVIKYEEEGGIATITMNRPEAFNSLSLELENELAEVMAAVSRDDSVRTVIITGAGRAFCAGGDVKDQGPGSRFNVSFKRRFEMLEHVQGVVLTIQNMRKPVIAMVNGYAMGAGMNLAVCCDIRIASDRAKFSEAFRNVGLTSDCAGTLLMPNLMGMGRTFEIYYVGETIDAFKAKELGLVNQVVPHDALRERTYELAKKLADGPTFALGLIKMEIYKGLKSDLETLLYYEAVGQALCMDTEDHAEGARAFKEKRKPIFKGK